MSSAPAVQGKSRFASLAVVYITVFVDLLGFGLILPILPFYARHFGANGMWVGVLMTAYSAAQFIGAPIVGRLSDLYGRRPLLLLTLAGSTVSLALTGCAQSLAMLIGARALAGLFGGSIAAAQAYVADATTREERSKYMGILGACIGLGFVFGPALGASLEGFGYGTAAFVAAGIAGTNFVVAIFRLKESRPKTVGAAAAPHKRHAHFSFAGLGRALSDPGIRPLLLTNFALTFGFVGMETTYALLGAQRFAMDARDLGFVFTFIGVIVVIIQGGLIGRLTRRFGEQRLALTGAFIMAVGLVLVPFAPSLLFSVGALGLLAVGQALTSPTLATMLSKCAGVDDQGGTLGLGQSLAAAARASSPLLSGFLYDADMAWPYGLGTLMCLIAAATVSSGGLAAALVAAKPKV